MASRHCHGKPPAMPEDMRNSTISGMVRVAVLNGNPIPLTLTLSHREREQPASDSDFREVRRADTALGVLKASGGFSLPRNLPLSRPSGTLPPSEGERDGVRGPLAGAGSGAQCAHNIRGILSPRERAGVRGEGDARCANRVGTCRKSADCPKGRMALSHSFFHASGFAGGH